MELDLEDFNKNVKVVPQNQPLTHLKPNPKLKVITKKHNYGGAWCNFSKQKKGEHSLITNTRILVLVYVPLFSKFLQYLATI